MSILRRRAPLLAASALLLSLAACGGGGEAAPAASGAASSGGGGAAGGTISIITVDPSNPYWKAEADTEVEGYVVPKGARVLTLGYQFDNLCAA